MNSLEMEKEEQLNQEVQPLVQWWWEPRLGYASWLRLHHNDCCCLSKTSSCVIRTGPAAAPLEAFIFNSAALNHEAACRAAALGRT